MLSCTSPILIYLRALLIVGLNARQILHMYGIATPRINNHNSFRAYDAYIVFVVAKEYASRLKFLIKILVNFDHLIEFNLITALFKSLNNRTLSLLQHQRVPIITFHMLAQLHFSLLELMMIVHKICCIGQYSWGVMNLLKQRGLFILFFFFEALDVLFKQ